VGSIIGDARYLEFSDLYSRKIKTNNPIYMKAMHNIHKQRLISLNNRGRSHTSGVRKGYGDDSFNVEMSRGYSTIIPRVRADCEQIHEFGPFLKKGRFSTYLNNFKLNYWRGRTIIFPLSYVNIIAWYLKIIPEKIKESFESVDKIFCALPSYVGSFRTLSKFSEPNPGYSGKFNLKLLNINKHLHRLYLPTEVRSAEIDDVYYAKITPDTHPGLITRKIAERTIRNRLGNVKRIQKSNLIFSAVSDVMNNWEKISKGQVGGTIGTYSVGSCEKI